jgi:hypothetical protein
MLRVAIHTRGDLNQIDKLRFPVQLIGPGRFSPRFIGRQCPLTPSCHWGARGRPKNLLLAIKQMGGESTEV